jgi:putative thioredoxin
LQLPGVDKLQAAIEKNPKDLQARLDLAEAFISVQAYEEALEQLLEIVKTDKLFGDGIGRKKMVDVFNMAAAQPEMVGKWRRALSAALN